MPRSKDGRWDIPCKRCGKVFTPRDPSRRFCSQKCSNAEFPGVGGKKPAVGLDPRVCPVCGAEFQPYRANQVACSRKHYNQLPEVRERHSTARRTPEYRDRKNELRRNSPAQQARIYQYNRVRNLAQYGLTPEDYERMLDEQDGKCILCGQPPKPDGIRAAAKLHADHDHVTGRHRDLLCLNCNRGLGYFKDDPDRLRAAAEYIERHRGRSLSHLSLPEGC